MNRRPAPTAEPIMQNSRVPTTNGGGTAVTTTAGGTTNPDSTDYQRLLRETAEARKAQHAQRESNENKGAGTTTTVPPRDSTTQSRPTQHEPSTPIYPNLNAPQPVEHHLPTFNRARNFPGLPTQEMPTAAASSSSAATTTSATSTRTSPPQQPQSQPSGVAVQPTPATHHLPTFNRARNFPGLPTQETTTSRSPPSQQQQQQPSRSSMPLEMPKKYDADEEYARKLQAEEETAASHHSRHSKEEIERRKREQDDAKIAQELAKKYEAEEADARLARQLQNEGQQQEDSDESKRNEDTRIAQELARKFDQEERYEERDAALARALQLQESGHSIPGDSPPSATASSSVNRESSVRRARSPDQDGEVLMDMSEDSDETMDEMHRRHQEANRLRQLQNSADAISSHGSSSSSSGSSAQNQRTREQLIRRLHQLQGSYSGVAPHRSASFRFTPDGRLVVHVESDDEDEVETRAAIDRAATHGVEDSPSPPAADAEEQRQALEAYARRRQLERDQQQQQSASNPGGFFGVFGNMLHHYMSNSRQGIPFPFSLLPQGASSSSSSSSNQWHANQNAAIDVDSMNYDQLLQLEEALGSVKPRVKAANRNEIESLPVDTFKKPAARPAAASSSSSKPSSPVAQECSICLCEFEDGDVIKTLPCMHRFHAHEIDKWLLTNEKCPICQTPATTVSDVQEEH